MARLSDALRRRRRCGGIVVGDHDLRDQSGFALMATLMIILMTSVLVMAVLSLSITSTLFSTQQIQRDRATRDADGAMETAVNVLRHEGQALGTPAAGCQGLMPQNAGFPVVQGETGNDTVVDCTALTPNVPFIPTDADLNSQSVNLVGADYGTAHGSINPTTFPWSTALGATNGATVSGIAASHASLVSSGSDPLPFTNPVNVHSSAAVIRDPVNGTSGQNGPALTVGAGYTQGDLGPLGTADNKCGILNPYSQVPATQIVSRPDAPVCGSVGAQALTANQADDPSTDNNWSLDVRTQRNRTGAVNSNCSALPTNGDPTSAILRQGADLIVFPPGAYDVGALNAMLNSASCANKVFWFTPGLYWFGCGPSQPTTTSCDPANNDALRFNNASSVVVFGAGSWPAFPVPTLAQVRKLYPRACNPDLAGVAITLQSRTVIRHDAGQVAVCDRSTAGQPMATAIFQPKKLTPNWPGSGTNPPASSSSPGTSIGGYTSVNFTNLSGLGGSGPAAAATASCGAPFWRIVFTGWIWGFIPRWEKKWFQDCGNSGATVQVSTWANPVPAVSGTDNPIRNVQLRIAGSAANLDRGSQINLALTNPAAVSAANPTGVVCQISKTANQLAANVPSNGGSFTFDITVDLSTTCPNIRNLQDLNNMGARVTAQMVPRCNTAWFFGASNDPTNKNKCSVDDLPRIAIGLVSLSATGTDEGAAGTAFRVTSDASTDPTKPASFNVYGRVSAPLADLDIFWNGTPFQGTSGSMDPIFGGSIYFNGLGSKINGAAGATSIVCCTQGQASERRVQLRAWTDLSLGTGVLSGTAVVTIQDWRLADDTELDDAGINASNENRVVVDPGHRARIESWNLCAAGRTTYSMIAGVCRAP